MAMGGFATTLLTVSLAMMEFRGVHTQTVFVGDLCFVAGIGLLISAQWEMAKGNTFAYTVLSAFGKLATILPLLHSNALLLMADRSILWRLWFYYDTSSRSRRCVRWCINTRVLQCDGILRFK